jgi:rhamnose transport system ATP-binding protein
MADAVPPLAVVPALDIRGVSMRFGATQALKDVSLTLYPGEVHALLGENGAGKSTLIKIMTGMYQPDDGEIFRDGKAVHIENAAQAQQLGIAAIYQEPRIFPDLNVAENIFIAQRGRGNTVNWRKMYAEAEAILRTLDSSFDVRQSARGLTLANQQTLEIAKALSMNARVLIMDEPTASLSAHEVAQLFSLTRKLREQGVAILFISHRMEEVFEIADRVTVFRDGQMISTAPIAEVTTERAIHDMVGRTLDIFFAKQESVIVADKPPLLSVSHLSKEGVFSDISFDIRPGEVVGFAGLVGARRTDVALALFGIAPANSGTITFNGQVEHITSPQQAMALRIAYVPEDRHEQGLVLPLSITANVTLPTLNRFLSGLGVINRGKEEAVAHQYRERLTIRSASVRLPVSQLSGGNQQKVVLAKWLHSEPLLLILDEPTRGIDVGAKAEVHHIINDLAAQGLGIMLISSDLPEVLAMSDRIVVMREGRQMGIFNHAEATQETVMTAAMGQLERV